MEQFVIILATLVVMVLRYAFMETGRPSEHDGKYKSTDPSSLCHQIFNVKKMYFAPVHNILMQFCLDIKLLFLYTIYYFIERNVPGPAILMRRYTSSEL